MTSVMALDGITSFLRLKDVTNTCKRMRHSLTIGRISSLQCGKLEEAEYFKCVFAVNCVLESIYTEQNFLLVTLYFLRLF